MSRLDGSAWRCERKSCRILGGYRAAAIQGKSSWLWIGDAALGVEREILWIAYWLQQFKVSQVGFMSTDREATTMVAWAGGYDEHAVLTPLQGTSVNIRSPSREKLRVSNLFEKILGFETKRAPALRLLFGAVGC